MKREIRHLRLALYKSDDKWNACRIGIFIAFKNMWPVNVILCQNGHNHWDVVFVLFKICNIFQHFVFHHIVSSILDNVQNLIQRRKYWYLDSYFFVLIPSVDVGPASMLVGNLVAGKRIAQAIGRELGVVEDQDLIRKVPETQKHTVKMFLFQSQYIFHC